MTLFLAILGGLASVAAIFKGGQWFLQRFLPAATPEQVKEEIDKKESDAQKSEQESGRPS